MLVGDVFIFGPSQATCFPLFMVVTNRLLAALVSQFADSDIDLRI